MNDVDDPRTGAFVPTTRRQLEEFEAPDAFVTLDDGQRISVRRHRDALNHMRSRNTRGHVTWGIRRKAWKSYEQEFTPVTAAQRDVFDRVQRQLATDPTASSAVITTGAPDELLAYADLLDQIRRRRWAAGDEGGAREVAVYVGAARIRARELAADLGHP